MVPFFYAVLYDNAMLYYVKWLWHVVVFKRLIHESTLQLRICILRYSDIIFRFCRGWRPRHPALWHCNSFLFCGVYSISIYLLVPHCVKKLSIFIEIYANLLQLLGFLIY